MSDKSNKLEGVRENKDARKPYIKPHIVGEEIIVQDVLATTPVAGQPPAFC